MPIRLDHITDEHTPSCDDARTGRVIVENRSPMSIWYLKAVFGRGNVDRAPDRLEGPILSGGVHSIDLIPGTYRLVAETGGGTVFRSPLIQVDTGGVARWEIAW